MAVKPVRTIDCKEIRMSLEYARETRQDDRPEAFFYGVERRQSEPPKIHQMIIDFVDMQGNEARLIVRIAAESGSAPTALPSAYDQLPEPEGEIQ